MIVIFIVGLPGSGKTTLGCKLSGVTGCSLHDDVKSIPVSSASGIILTSPDFCIPSALEGAKKKALEVYPGAEIICLFFENDPEQCLKNARQRQDKPVSRYIKYLSSVYNPPEFSLKVYKGV